MAIVGIYSYVYRYSIAGAINLSALQCGHTLFIGPMEWGVIIGFISLAAKYGSLNVGVSFNLLAGALWMS